MSADHSEARERARFEQDAKGVFANPPEGIDPFRTRGDGSYFWGNVESAWQLWQAGRRSLEQERWIAVEERQPDDDREILLHVADWRKREHHECVVLRNYLPNQQIFRPSGSHGWEKSVTAWMEKPAPPVHKGDSYMAQAKRDLSFAREAELATLYPKWPCPRCGASMKTVGSPWDWDNVCPNCGPISDTEAYRG